MNPLKKSREKHPQIDESSDERKTQEKAPKITEKEKREEQQEHMRNHAKPSIHHERFIQGLACLLNIRPSLKISP
jgi:hypothetical protein